MDTNPAIERRYRGTVAVLTALTGLVALLWRGLAPLPEPSIVPPGAVATTAHAAVPAVVVALLVPLLAATVRTALQSRALALLAASAPLIAGGLLADPRVALPALLAATAGHVAVRALAGPAPAQVRSDAPASSVLLGLVLAAATVLSPPLALLLPAAVVAVVLGARDARARLLAATATVGTAGVGIGAAHFAAVHLTFMPTGVPLSGGGLHLEALAWLGLADREPVATPVAGTPDSAVATLASLYTDGVAVAVLVIAVLGILAAPRTWRAKLVLVLLLAPAAAVAGQSIGTALPAALLPVTCLAVLGVRTLTGEDERRAMIVTSRVQLAALAAAGLPLGAALTAPDAGPGAWGWWDGRVGPVSAAEAVFMVVVLAAAVLAVALLARTVLLVERPPLPRPITVVDIHADASRVTGR